jgi:hypothetical protein
MLAKKTLMNQRLAEHGRTCLSHPTICTPYHHHHHHHHHYYHHHHHHHHYYRCSFRFRICNCSLLSLEICCRYRWVFCGTLRVSFATVIVAVSGSFIRPILDVCLCVRLSCAVHCYVPTTVFLCHTAALRAAIGLGQFCCRVGWLHVWVLPVAVAYCF